MTRDAGLDLGQSLNGLGKSQGKISILLEEDAKELERDYVDKILNQSTWFMQGIKPTMIMFERGH